MKKNPEKLPDPRDLKKYFRWYMTAALPMVLVACFSITAYAAGDPISVVNNLSTFIFGLIRAVGLILLGFGVLLLLINRRALSRKQKATQERQVEDA